MTTQLTAVAFVRVEDVHLDSDSAPNPPQSCIYTEETLHAALRLVGCKGQQAHKAAGRFFETVTFRALQVRDRVSRQSWRQLPYKDSTCGIAMDREQFIALVLQACRDHKPYHTEDLPIACSIVEKRSCFCLLLCGTSGTGKSTISSLLGTRLGVTTVISSDNVRHMIRGFCTKEENPLLYASTYQAGEHFDPGKTVGLENMSEKTKIIKGYKAQSAEVMEHLERLIASCEARNESMICEGVHLCLSFVVRLMARHRSVVPVLIYIKSESKHKERFAVRAKYMTLDPAKNRYIKYFSNIRTIQDYLLRKAEKYMVPQVDNTNIDRSVGLIHATLLGCLRQSYAGVPMYDPADGTARAVMSEFLASKQLSWSSKDVLELIRRKAAQMYNPNDAPSTSSAASAAGEAATSSAAAAAAAVTAPAVVQSYGSPGSSAVSGSPGFSLSSSAAASRGRYLLSSDDEDERDAGNEKHGTSDSDHEGSGSESGSVCESPTDVDEDERYASMRWLSGLPRTHSEIVKEALLTSLKTQNVVQTGGI